MEGALIRVIVETVGFFGEIEGALGDKNVP